jgi:hypothetical protein
MEEAMQIRTQVTSDGDVQVTTIDPSDGRVAHYTSVGCGEQVVVTATTAASPADIEFGEVGPIPTEGEDSAPAEDAPDTEAESADAGEPDGEPDEPEDQAA